MHTHNVTSDVSSSEWEVSGYGNNLIGDIKDHWRVEIVGEKTSGTNSRVKSLITKFRLRNVYMGCLLHYSRQNLPEWGFKQMEVVCQKKPDNSSTENFWNIEKHINDKLEKGHKGLYKNSFFENFIELNIAMWITNNALTIDPKKEPNPIEMSPYEWPLLFRGMRMCAWNELTVKYYLIGNPVIWWSVCLSLVSFVFLWSIYVVRNKRGNIDFKNNGNIFNLRNMG